MLGDLGHLLQLQALTIVQNKLYDLKHAKERRLFYLILLFKYSSMMPCAINIDWPSLITAVAAFATAIATFLTVQQIKKQREVAYKPYLSFDKAYFSVQPSRNENIFYPTKWNENFTSEFYVDDPTKLNSNTYNLKLCNIGFATAKNVQIKISYDKNGFIEMIKKLENKFSQELRINIEEGNTFITFTPGQKIPWKGIGFSKNIGSDSHFVSVLPVNITKDFSLVSLPFAFLELSNIYMFYLGMLLGKEKVEPSIPMLTVYISYENIANDKLTQRFTILTDLWSWGGGSYSGQFILSEINS